MSKAPDEDWDYFDLLAENAQVWDTTQRIDKTKPGPISKGNFYHIKEDDDVNARLTKLTRKVEAMDVEQSECDKDVRTN